MKKYGLLGGVVLAIVAMALIVGPFLAMAQGLESGGWNEGDVRMAEVFGSTSGPTLIEEPCEDLRLAAEAIERVLKDGGKRQPLLQTMLPPNVAEKVLQAVEAEGDGKARIIYTTTIEKGHNALVKLQPAELPTEGVRFFEAVVAGHRVEIREITRWGSNKISSSPGHCGDYQALPRWLGVISSPASEQGDKLRSQKNGDGSLGIYSTLRKSSFNLGHSPPFTS